MSAAKASTIQFVPAINCIISSMGLWMIFLDHIPDDVVAWLTLKNYGFSDAAEFFVFISGYLAGYIYGPIIAGGNFIAAAKRLWTRVWQMYVAHIMSACLAKKNGGARSSLPISRMCSR